jgi:hypothetical protein
MFNILIFLLICIGIGYLMAMKERADMLRKSQIMAAAALRNAGECAFRRADMHTAGPIQHEAWRKAVKSVGLDVPSGRSLSMDEIENFRPQWEREKSIPGSAVSRYLTTL